jgi:hypothetical protein
VVVVVVCVVFAVAVDRTVDVDVGVGIDRQPHTVEIAFFARAVRTFNPSPAARSSIARLTGADAAHRGPTGSVVVETTVTVSGGVKTVVVSAVEVTVEMTVLLLC